MSSGKILPRVLLFEPHFVMRRTIVSVARDLGVAEVRDASTLERTRALLAHEAYDGVVLDFDDPARTTELLSELRAAKLGSPADARVIVLAAELRPREEQQLEALEVARILRKPFKIGDLLNAVAAGAHGLHGAGGTA